MDGDSKATVRPLGERCFARLGFPFALVATVGGALALIGAGVDPLLATVSFVGANYLFIALAERIVPLHRSWLHAQGDVKADIGLAATTSLTTALLGPVVIAGSVLVGAWLAGWIGMGLWPSAWPLLAQLALALVIAELVEYSFHRAMHEIPGLWRFHATHHSAPRLYWLNALRFHPIDIFLIGNLKLAPLAVLGAGLPIFALVNLFSAVHGSFQHANVPVRLGPLNWIFSMAELHRWHHSPQVEESNSNYGGNLILWDVVFGTRFLPKDREPPEEIGMATLPNFPMGFWANLASPFRWRRVVEQSTSPASSPAPSGP